jgi:histo-blood group ABO system transferase
MTQDLTPKIGLLLVATNKYISFVDQLVESADKWFLSNCDVTYCVFTNNSKNVNTLRSVNMLDIEHEDWPMPTLKRYDYFHKYAEYLKNFDYLYYCDVDMKFVNIVGNEILGDIVATLHPGFWNKINIQFSYERRPECNAYIPYGNGNKYYAGGFNGGSSNKFLNMAKTIVSWRKEDEINGIVPVWHDESYMNKYMYLNSPTKVLNPSYCYPESWDIPFEKRLLALDKNHNEMRSL